MNKLSYTSINKYLTCGKQYDFHYNQKLREASFSSALGFGKAVDDGLNVLLKTKDVIQAINIFVDSWGIQNINGKPTFLHSFSDMKYSSKDLDVELLTSSDVDMLKSAFNDVCKTSVYAVLDSFNDKPLLTTDEKAFYNYACWLSLKQKGIYIIENYAANILPKMKQVLAVQHKFDLQNGEGDSIIGYADFICQWEDGKTYLMDNKTSSRDYAKDSASKSPQLILYHHKLKEEYKLDGVGYIVLDKTIFKNKTKICSKCGFNGTGARHKTCPEDVQGERCAGDWLEKINPSCKWNAIFDTIDPHTEEMVLNAFNEANTGIKNNIYNRNFSACDGMFPCAYKNKCWKNSNEGLVTVENKKDF